MKGIGKAKIQELREIHLLGFSYREQTEAMAARVCEILGVDPTIDSTERDWCEEIVFHGIDPQIVVDRIEKLRRQNERSYKCQ